MGRVRCKVRPLRFLAPLAGPEAGPCPVSAVATLALRSQESRPQVQSLHEVLQCAACSSTATIGACALHDHTVWRTLSCSSALPRLTDASTLGGSNANDEFEVQAFRSLGGPRDDLDGFTVCCTRCPEQHQLPQSSGSMHRGILACGNNA